MTTFLSIILLAFCILQIILFFKVWRMTNNVKKIKNKLYADDFFFPANKLYSNTPLFKNAFDENVKKINKMNYLGEKEAARRMLLSMKYDLEQYCNSCEKYLEKEVQVLSIPFFKEIDNLLAKL